MPLIDDFFRQNRGGTGTVDVQGGPVVNQAPGAVGPIPGAPAVNNAGDVDAAAENMFGVPPAEPKAPKLAIPQAKAVDLVKNDSKANSSRSSIVLSASDSFTSVTAPPTDGGGGGGAGANLNIFSVRLPIPNNINAVYMQHWEDGDTSSLGAEIYKSLDDLGGDLTEGSGTAGVLAALTADAEDIAHRKGGVIAKKLKDTATGKILGPAAANYRDFASKEVVNTKREILYKGSDFRTFTFEFDIAPTNETEVTETLAFMKGLKYWSAPSKKAGGETIKFPAYFTLDFAQTDIGMKIGKSVLTRMDVNYTPDGMWQTFRNGFPVHLKLSLEFKEVELIYRETILSGAIY